MEGILIAHWPSFPNPRPVPALLTSNMAPSRLDSPPADSSGFTVSDKSNTAQPGADDTYGNYYPADPATLSLESNFGPMDAESIGYLQPTSNDTPLEIMRERFERDGYLFVGPLSFVNPADPIIAYVGTIRLNNAFPKEPP